MKQERIIADRFRVLGTLGHGGMSEVLLAQDMLLNQQLALKLIHPHHARDERILSRFKREVELSRQLNHPGIIRIYDLYDLPEAQLLFLSMEYLSGGNLKSRLQRPGALSMREVLSAGIETLKALEAAHEQGIIHRDIKPHNILFTADGQVKLTDFGLARTSLPREVLTDAAAAGTPEYCPPETVLGEFSDVRSDLYSLGISLFEALCGKPPFTASSPYAVLRQQVEAPLPVLRELRPDVPEEVEAIIRKATEKDPASRFQSAGEFRQALEKQRLPRLKQYASGLFCRSCGESVSRTLPYCFRCGQAVLQIMPGERTKGGWSVIVLGSGKAGDKLSAEDRSSILRILKQENITTGKLEKRLPRVPFSLIRNLDKSSAEMTARLLTENGIPAAAAGKGAREENRRTRKAVLGKIRALSPRLWLIIMGSSMGLFNSIINHTSGAGFAVLGLLYFMGFLSVPIFLALSFRSPQLTLEKGSDGEVRLPSVQADFLRTARQLSSPPLRGLAKSVAGKLDALRSAFAASPEIPREQQHELESELLPASRRWLEILRQTQDIEGLLQHESEAEIRRNLSEQEQRFRASAQAEDAWMIQAEKQEQLREVEDRRKLEQLRDLNMDALLRYSSFLDRILLQLSRFQTVEMEKEVVDLKEEMQVLADLRDALTELGQPADSGRSGEGAHT